MENKEIIANLKTLAKLSEIHDVNPFKVRALNNAIFSLERAGKKLSDCSRADLEKIDGVGKSIAGHIDELLNQGTCSDLQALLDKTPPGILEISKLPGLGAKKVKALWQELGIDSPDRLGEEIESGNLSGVKGFGEKTTNNLSEALRFYLSQKDKMRYPEAMERAEALLKSLQDEYPESRWEITGALRRKCQVIDRIEVLGERKKQKALIFLKQSPEIELLPRECSPYILRGRYSDSGMPVWVRLAEEEDFEIELFKSTGSALHVEEMLGAATGELTNETDIYKSAGVVFYPPEMREDSAPVTMQSQDMEKIVTHSDIHGVLHAHSSYSDGRNTLEEMADAAKKMGYSYLGITDHSKSSFFYANGLFENRIRQQHEEIDRLNERMSGFRIFKGIECDILPDGRLDYEDEVLESFDFIICSVHSVLQMDAETATKRLLRAIQSPYTTILGHMTGRLLLRRPGYPVHMEYILEACAENNVAIELNANPNRLDVDWHWLSRMQESGIKTSINPDAHSIEGMRDIQFGVDQARKGLLKTENNLSSFSLEQLTSYFQERKENALSRA